MARDPGSLVTSLALSVLILGGCSLTHDLDALSKGSGGAVGTTSSSTATGCEPKTCAEASPACGAIDDGCGNALECNCVAPSICDETGTCACPTTPTETSAKLPKNAKSTTGVGKTWTNVSAIRSDTDSGGATSVVLPASAKSMILQAYGFDFSEIPANATIESVKLTLCKWKLPNNGLYTVEDQALDLLIGGMIMPKTDRASDVTWIYHNNTCLPVPYEWKPDGKTLVLAPEDVQNPFFGVSLVVENPHTTGVDVTANIDWLTMTVAYYEACTARSE